MYYRLKVDDAVVKVWKDWGRQCWWYRFGWPRDSYGRAYYTEIGCTTERQAKQRAKIYYEAMTGKRIERAVWVRVDGFPPTHYF